MDKKTRICIWVIMLGLANFLVYTIIYMFIGGEAVNGWIEQYYQVGDGARHVAKTIYFLQSQHVVSRSAFLYSGIHSISIWLTVAAVMLAMLTLAKERIVSSMHTTIVRGRTFITILATVITFTTVVITIWFILQFVERFNHPKQIYPPAVTTTLSQPAVRAGS